MTIRWTKRRVGRDARATRANPASVAKRIETKAMAPLIAIENLAAARWGPRNYSSFAREGMMQNAVVYRCVRIIAEAAASMPLLAYRGDEEDADADILSLIRRPCPGLTATDFFESWYGYLLVSGNAYVEAIAVEDRIAGLHLLRPDRMQVVAGRDGWPSGYLYSCGDRRRVISGDAMDGVSRILHQKLFHPVDDHHGLSPLEAASTAIDIHNSASRWNKALLDNAARPSGALVYTAGDHLTAEQFARLKGELEENFQGARNAGRPLLLEGGLDWKAMSLTPRDMDFMAAKDSAAREIALALGVPPMLLGIPGDNTYANYQEANRTFWRQTVLPLVSRTARAFAEWLSPAYEEAVRLQPDVDAIEALSAEREALWRRLEASSFLSTDEKRAVVGYGPASPDL